MPRKRSAPGGKKKNGKLKKGFKFLRGGRVVKAKAAAKKRRRRR